MGVLNLSVRRNLAFLAFPASIQIGGLQQEQERDSRRRAKTWTYSPPNGDPSITPYLTTSTPYGDQRVSNVLAWRAFQSNPGLFVQTPAQIVANARDYITNSVYLKEKISAAYVQGEMRLLNNRLNVLTGVRFEKTVDSGRGPLEQLSAVFARNPDGTFLHNAAGARVRRPEAGAAGSIEELSLTYKERAYGARRTYDGFFPSLHLNFNVTENFIARAAYAKTYGRPNFAEIIPTLQEREDDPAGITNPGVALGRVTTSNTGLKPWSADNYDLSLEYYTRQGGVFSLGLFRKEIDNFFGNFAKIATLEELNALGLDARYVGWEVLSKVNAGNARISGFEFNFKHDLDRLGAWGKHFTVFVNGTKLKLQGNREADFLGYIPDSANWGVTFRRNPITFVARWNYRGKYQAGTFTTMGPDAYHYNWSKKPTLDLNLDYSVHRKISFFANAKNVFNEKSLGSRYGSETPEYAKLFQPASVGVVISVGIKGTF
jgi:TonB-dependent receptor